MELIDLSSMSDQELPDTLQGLTELMEAANRAYVELQVAKKKAK